MEGSGMDCSQVLHGSQVSEVPAVVASGNLILTRKSKQTILIGDDVAVTIDRIRGNQVRLAINAPKNVRVHRKEVFDAIQVESQRQLDGNNAAGDSSPLQK